MSYTTKGEGDMTRSITAILTLVILVSTSSGIAQSMDPIDELKACARMTDRNARFACFDSLGKRVLLEESADKSPTRGEVAQPDAITPAAATSAQPQRDDLGTSTFGDDQESKSVKDQDSESVTYEGRITSCKQGHYGDWYFFFDNGQVWINASRSNLRFKECDFKVKVTKDLFSYKMWIDDAKKPIRIRLHK